RQQPAGRPDRLFGVFRVDMQVDQVSLQKLHRSLLLLNLLSVRPVPDRRRTTAGPTTPLRSVRRGRPASLPFGPAAGTIGTRPAGALHPPSPPKRRSAARGGPHPERESPAATSGCS